MPVSSSEENYLLSWAGDFGNVIVHVRTWCIRAHSSYLSAWELIASVDAK